jgi:membrane-associated phospholipid phosphatase
MPFFAKPVVRGWIGLVLGAVLCLPLPLAAELLKDASSPVTTPARTPLLVGTGLTLTLLVFEDQIVDPVQAEVTEDRPLGKWSKLGDYGGQLIPNAVYAGGMLVAGALGEAGAYGHAEVMALGSLYAVTTSSLLKISIREPRPGPTSDRQSFPSGHTTAAFAFASVVGAEHGFFWGVPAYGLACLVAFSRMNDNKHYLHDVAAGATIGTAYGLGIHYLRAGGVGGGGLTVSPIWGPDRRGILVSYGF